MREYVQPFHKLYNILVFILAQKLLKRDNRPQIESFVRNPMSANQELLPHLIAVQPLPATVNPELPGCTSEEICLGDAHHPSLGGEPCLKQYTFC